MTDLAIRVRQVLDLDPADHATKSRDYGRGYAEALRQVKEILSVEPRPQPRRLIDICMIPACGCNGDAHP